MGETVYRPTRRSQPLASHTGRGGALKQRVLIPPLITQPCRKRVRANSNESLSRIEVAAHFRCEVYRVPLQVICRILRGVGCLLGT